MTDSAQRLRPIDLARSAGISTQQVRNYEETGVVPTAPRSPTGYRRYDQRHHQALLTYRTLAAGYGPSTAQQIMRAVHGGDRATALALIDAGHATAHSDRISLHDVGAALESIADQDPKSPPLPRTRLRIGEVGRHLGVRTSALRVWEAAGLLVPGREPGTGYRHFAPTDVRDARMVQMLRQSHYRFAQIRPVLAGLRETGNTHALYAAIEQRQVELTDRATAMLAGAAKLHAYLELFEPPHPGSPGP